MSFFLLFHILIVLSMLFVRKMSFFLGVSTRQYGQSSLIGANVGQDSKNSSRNVIYVCNTIFAKVYCSLYLCILFPLCHARFTSSLYFHQVDQPKGVLSRQMYINNTGQYDKYFNAYKDLTVGLAKLLIRENNANMSINDSYLNLAFENMLKLETKIAKVIVVLLALLLVTILDVKCRYITIRECKS